MNIGYIKKEKLDKIFSKIEIRKFNNNYVIAIDNEEKLRKKKRLPWYIKKLNINTIVFSKKLDGEFKDEICGILKCNNINILNGKYLMDLMKFEIVKYVLSKQNKKMKKEDVYIIFKKDSKLDLNFLKEFIENFKMTNIVTNDVERLKNVQENLLHHLHQLANAFLIQLSERIVLQDLRIIVSI